MKSIFAILCALGLICCAGTAPEPEAAPEAAAEEAAPVVPPCEQNDPPDCDKPAEPETDTN
jgi:hypothetical protein